MDTQPQAPTPAARITVLLKLANEGFEDAFGAEPAWVEAPADDYQELRDVVGPERLERLQQRIGLRRGDAYRAGGPAGTVTLAPEALRGVLGLLGMAALPPDVIVDETPRGPQYHVPDTWFHTEAHTGPAGRAAAEGDGGPGRPG
jgi:hypothetical protein